MGTRKPHYAWMIMISCCAIMAVGLGVLNTGMSLFVQPVSEALGIGRGTFTLSMTVQSLAGIVAVPLAGKILPKYDMRVTLSVATVATCFLFGIMGTFTSAFHFFIAGALRGLSNVFIMMMPVALLIEQWFDKKMGFAMGFSMAFSGIGAAVFSPIGNYFITQFGWRVAYAALAGIGAVILLPFTIFVIRSRPSDKGLQAYGAGEAPAQEEDKNKEEPARWEGVSAKRALRSASFYIFCLFACCICFIGTITTHVPGITSSEGFGAATAANSLSVFMVGVVIGKILIGYLNDRMGISIAHLIVSVLSLTGTILVIFASGHIVVLFCGVMLLGFGASIFTIVPPLAIRAIFGHKEYSAIYSYISTLNALIAAFGVSIYGFLYDLSGSYLSSLVLVAAFLLIGVVSLQLSLRFGKKLRNE